MSTETHDSNEHHHEIGPSTLIIVWLALTILTAVTVFTALEIDLGRVMNMVIAMVIASVKASIVAYYFMHLKFEDKLTWVYAIYPLFLLLLLIATTIMEVFTRVPAIS